MHGPVVAGVKRPALTDEPAAEQDAHPVRAPVGGKAKACRLASEADLDGPIGPLVPSDGSAAPLAVIVVRAPGATYTRPFRRNSTNGGTRASVGSSASLHTPPSVTRAWTLAALGVDRTLPAEPRDAARASERPPRHSDPHR
jgi:hypothetical protein